MGRSFFASLFTVFVLMGCGSEPDVDSDNIPTGSPPLVLDIQPDQGAPGAVVTVSGLGYSVVPQENIIHLGSFSIIAENYTLVAGREELTFTVPNGIAAGLYTVLVTVLDAPSNADMNFTVTP